MPPTKTTSGGASSRPADRDDLDSVFGDFDDDDPFRPFSPPKAVKAPAKVSAGFTNSRNNRDAEGLGLDEEVEVTKKPRAPRVKLDETRLLSDAGIKKLRRTAKDKLKFKGKGHEFSDCARLLSFYQLWLDDLFPKANFADALSMVEKLGHKKTMQRMRTEWINEGKPRDSVHDDSVFDDPVPEARDREKSQTAARIAPIFEQRQRDRAKTPQATLNVEDEDIYGVSPQPKKKSTATVKSIFGGGSNDIPEDDDLDALFGQDVNTDARNKKTHEPDAPEDDDLDALFGEESNTNKAPSNLKTTTAQEDFDDDEAAMAEMDMDW